MNIVWFSWKDIKHPTAGGAEKVSHEIMRRLVLDGHAVRLITASYLDAERWDTIDGIEVYRTGNRYTVYIKACFLYKKTPSDWPDLVVDEMNTIPFGSGFYSRNRNILLTYQLAREVWFAQAVLPLSIIGYLAEPLYLYILSRKYRTVLTESESTRADLQKYGFAANNVHTFRVGIELDPIKTLPSSKGLNNILVLGAIRPMKRTLSAVKGFEYAHSTNSLLRLTIAGDISSKYANKVLKHINKSPHRNAITVLGKVSSAEKLILMRQASVILVTSVKEGWGLIVTEANSQGTPAIAFDSDGLRDSIIDGSTGLLVPSGNEEALGVAINQLLTDEASYKTLRKSAWESSKQYTFENSYKDFLRICKLN